MCSLQEASSRVMQSRTASNYGIRTPAASSRPQLSFLQLFPRAPVLLCLLAYRVVASIMFEQRRILSKQQEGRIILSALNFPRAQAGSKAEPAQLPLAPHPDLTFFLTCISGRTFNCIGAEYRADAIRSTPTRPCGLPDFLQISGFSWRIPR